jgi:hypothetical protein
MPVDKIMSLRTEPNDEVTEYAVSVTKCPKCKQIRVKYPRIWIGPNKWSQGLDVLCACEKIDLTEKRKGKVKSFDEEMAEIESHLNPE